MNNKVKIGIAFGLGAAGGIVGAYFYLKKQFSALIDAQIEQVCDYYENNYIPKDNAQDYSDWVETKTIAVPEPIPEPDKTEETKEEAPVIASEKPPITEYVDYASKTKKYKTKAKKPKEPEEYKEPYPITMNEFGNEDGYEVTGLYCFDDGIISTDQYEVLSEEDIHKYLGPNPLSSRGANEEDDLDTLYIRNETLKTDFEIAFDCRRYDEVPDTIKPYHLNE